MFTNGEAYQKITELVEWFGEKIKSKKHSDYKETLTRLDCIDHIFKALHWDKDKSQGYIKVLWNVIHKDS